MSMEATPGYPAPEMACSVVATILVMPNCLSGAEPHGEDDGGAVGIGDDLALPSAGALLAGDEFQVIGVDFGDEQRHIALHAMVARIRDHDVPGLGESALNFGGDGGVHGGKEQAGRVAGLAVLHGEIGDGIGDDAEVPCHGVAVLLAGGAVAGAEPDEIEPGMSLEKLDKVLAHHAGGAEDSYFDARLHNSLTIR